ncbi:MAG: TolC family protein [Candidatus Omnitrophica bacterium]|nr:TolC family protein [Candidatus Omnitrophota bacterium]
MKSIFFIISLCIICFCFTSFAQESAVEVSLDTVMHLALTNSLDIQIAKYDTYIKRVDLSAAESIFDTLLNLEASYLKDKAPPSSTVSSTKKIEKTYLASLTKKMPTGTTLTLSGGDFRSDSDSGASLMNPYHKSFAGISLGQSLGKNFFGLADRALIKITKIDIENAVYSSLDDIEYILYQVQVAYWNLALKQEELKVKRSMLGEARRLHRIYKDKYQIGTAESTALFAMAANEKIREAEVLTARLEEEKAKNDLLCLLNEGNMSIKLKTADPLAMEPQNYDFYESLKVAIASRRDYRRVSNALRANGVDLKVKRNALWPEIDLEASFTKNGLSRKFSDAISQVPNQDNPQIYFGIKLQIPLENNLAKSDLRKTQLQNEQLLLSLKQTERLILKGIANEVKEVNTASSQLELAEAVVQLQQSKLDMELKSLGYGRSSSDLIIRYQDDLLLAKLSHAYAFFQYRIAQINLQLAKNTLLKQYWSEDQL